MKNSGTQRILIAAPKSGSGKTLITCAILGAIKNRNIDVCSFKCGPDYIDPMFHRNVLGINSENLDSFLAGASGAAEVFNEISSSHEMAVIEGVMGVFDGVGGVEIEGSSYDIARITGAKIVLVFDVHGMGRSMIPMIKGFLDADTEGLICGIILNRISKDFYGRVSEILKEELSKEDYNVKLLGYFPVRKDLVFSSRHLGLVLPGEISEIEDQLKAAAEQAEESLDIDALLELSGYKENDKESMGTVLSDSFSNRSQGEPSPLTPLTIAVARDEAFCFYYEANMRLLEKLGITLKYFSPLHDRALPGGISGILLGGGYPELYGKELSENTTMREDIKKAIESGMPSLAECGGFMYLHDSITDQEGNEWPGCGVIEGSCSYKGKLVRFGYVQIKEKQPVFLPEGEPIRAHEFHYYDSSSNGNACIAEKPGSQRTWECAHEGKEHFWSFAHLYYPSAPEFAEHFAEEMRDYGKFIQIF